MTVATAQWRDMTDQANKTPKDTLDELRVMVVDYAKQETLDPLKNLGNWVKFGLVGGLLIAIGGVLIGLGVLRLLQQVSALDGGWNFVPYLGVVLLLGLVIGALGFAAQKKPGTK